MKQYKKILVPVDGSAESDLAFERALEFARMVDGEVTIINVTHHVIQQPGPMTIPVKPDWKEVAEEVIKQYLDRVKDSNVEVLSIVRHGIPSDEIIGISGNYDIIIMGSRGHNPLTNLLIGSVAEKVARGALCPVMIVRENKGNRSQDE